MLIRTVIGPYAKSQMGYDLLAATLIYDSHYALSKRIVGQSLAFHNNRKQILN